MTPSNEAQNPKRGELTDLVFAARMHLELERSYGADRVPFHPERVKELREKQRQARSAPKAPPPFSDKVAALEELRKELSPCSRCGLGTGRTNLVFGAGSPDAGLMFVGEAPGHDEDLQGIPFVGLAGKLLTKIIEAMGLTRDQVYIANICKCRPPGNRLPAPDEVAACLPHLHRQIEIIQPRILVTLGNLATQTLLKTTLGITKIRGRFTPLGDIEVMPTFHPSYLLRNPPAKREVWDDMQTIHARMRELGLEIGDLKKGK